MIQGNQQTTERPAPEIKTQQSPRAMCPMEKMCAGMMKKRPSGFLLMLPGVLLILVGALIVVEPRILIWLMATASVLLGILLLVMAGFIRRIGTQLHA